MTETEDALLGGRLRLLQPATGHRAGTDAILLAAACQPVGRRLGDFGAGIGTAGLAAALRLRPDTLTLVERDADMAALARRNAEINAVAGTQVVVCDLLNARARHAAGLDDNSLDDVICNPPWYDGRSHRVSPDLKKATAHAVEGGSDDIVVPWLRAASAMVRPGGTLTMIHRVEQLGNILAACAGRFGAVTVMAVHARPDQAAIRILVRGIKGSRAPLRIAPALILHDPTGAFTVEAEAIHRGEAAIGWP
ncbi:MULTISPECIES: methyltransferase [unclassified Beijerinckia]|uniref:tRNA1(Val) (adenine(37)-N6)-methyltransferase n=1 Tax=unclassified Beijerinckia TaxID=2638183 RepID=UPI000896B89B|nr:MULTISPECIES: methyltransferase [unclassified Beijerinckia]MDH7797038.1 tRNA1(Val) A37 N6-methylase TrmN6 [Beijerinckia sp. GAS462]SEC69682.1 tRNA1(Val) A37 N6-methylase TrmN6 [Beijerinckia sp. 28-YEA-48]